MILSNISEFPCVRTNYVHFSWIFLSQINKTEPKCKIKNSKIFPWTFCKGTLQSIIAFNNLMNIYTISHKLTNIQHSQELILFILTVMHAMSHHLYPNSYHDLECILFEPFFNWMPMNKNFIEKYVSWIVSPIVYGFIFPKTGFFRWVLYLRNWINWF